MRLFAFPTPESLVLRKAGFTVFPQTARSAKQDASAGFAQRRKTILNNLRDAPPNIQELLKKRGGASIVLCEAALPPLRRAEAFTLEEWALLVKAMV